MNAERETSNEPETTSNQGETTSNERDENGHFRKGNRGGPGNPFARQIARLRKALLDAVSEADLVEVIEMLKAQGQGGRRRGRQAAALLFHRQAGRAAQSRHAGPGRIRHPCQEP